MHFFAANRTPEKHFPLFFFSNACMHTYIQEGRKEYYSEITRLLGYSVFLFVCPSVCPSVCLSVLVVVVVVVTVPSQHKLAPALPI